MNIQSVTSVASALPAASLQLPPSGTRPAAGNGADFGSMLGNLLGSLSQVEQNTNGVLAQAATGQNVDVHDVAIALQSESLAFSLATQVRDKLVEAYQDVFRTQV
jgi:flagellar hook-basal body complex protein FliE